MGMVIIQPYILVSKLKKIKTKFLRCTGYLNSIKPPYKVRFIANSSSCKTTELSICKGPKYRFPVPIDFKSCREQIAGALQEFAGVNQSMSILMPYIVGN